MARMGDPTTDFVAMLELEPHDTDTQLRLLWIAIAVPGFLSSRVAVQALVASAGFVHMLVYISLLFVRLH